MTRLMLLRHARAGWASAGARDFDRSLTESGRKEARLLAEAMRAAGLLPDAILSSTALRAIETLEEMSDFIGDIPVTREDSLYNSDAVRYLRAVQAAHGARALLLVGHNPMLEDLTLALDGSGDPQLIAALRRGFPTAGLAVLTFEGNLAEIEPGSGRLEAFLAPGSPLAVR